MSHPVPLAVAMIVVVGLAGCALLDQPTREEEAVAALDETVVAAKAIESYRFDTRLRVSDGSNRMDARLSGTVDVAAEAMNGSMAVEDERRELYLLGETLYQQCLPPWDHLWAADEIDHEGAWWRATPLGTQLGLFETGDLAHRGTRRLDGEAAVLLVGSPRDPEIGSGASAGLAVGGPSVDDATARLWIDPETRLPMQIEVELQLSDGQETATASMTSRFAGYDEPVTVVAPTDATRDPWTACPDR